ncbi:glycosyltransferase [Spiribacter sp. 218]|uniref:glycosyltransferase n=1 Tax=Spiribacter pallidus TaxID=1987936 RepID=UPI00349F72AE
MSESEPGSILFVSRNFDRMAGGVERMATAMMNELVGRGWRVGLLTWDPEDAEAHYWLDPRVEWTRMTLGDPYVRASWAMRCQRLRLIRRCTRGFAPDVVIGFQSGAFAAARLALLGCGIPTIAAERNSPDQYSHVTRGWRKRMSANLVLGLATRITVQLPSYRVKYPPPLRPRIVAIPNPVEPVAAPPYPNESAPAPTTILNLGRLSFQKNQALLLRAFARIADDWPDWRVALVGDGEARAELEMLVDSLGLGGRVFFAGATRDIRGWFEYSAFLAFPSKWEGFPNALVEAFAHGVPAIGIRTTAGVNELVSDGKNGLLSDSDEIAFAHCMQELMVDQKRRAAMGRAAVAYVASYKPKAIYDRWEALLKKVSEQRCV